MSGSTDSLSHLVSRFTADRDELLTRVQECQDRVADLVGRLGAIEEVPRPALDLVDRDTLSVDLLRAEISALAKAIGILDMTYPRHAPSLSGRRWPPACRLGTRTVSGSLD